MTSPEQDRLVAWADELRRVHARLRQALEVARSAASGGAEPARDLLLLCHGFCVALDAHHRGEDGLLFPAVEREHPELRVTLRALQQDHTMIAELLRGLERAVEEAADPEELARHLQGAAAIMENHFRYEERQLLEILGSLDLDAEPRSVLGPLRPPAGCSRQRVGPG